MPEKVILHWLDQSRSHRVLWLLEELNVPYELKLYKRDKSMRAPKELNAIHPLGKSPVLEVVTATGESKIFAETGHIASYILRKYDTEKKLTPTSEDEQEQVDYFLHYVEGTLQPYLVSLLVGTMAKKMAPFGAGFLVGSVVNAMNDKYYATELLKNLDYLETIIKAQHAKGSNFFVGDKLTAADILLSFPIHQNIFSSPARANALTGNKFDVNQRFPHLSKWSEAITQQPNLIKSNHVIESLGAKL